MYQRYRKVYFWCLRKCPLYRGSLYGVLYWESPLVEVPLYHLQCIISCILMTSYIKGADMRARAIPDNRGLRTVIHWCITVHNRLSLRCAEHSC